MSEMGRWPEGLRIVVEREAKPVPGGVCDWGAWIEGMEEGFSVTGPTASMAVLELARRMMQAEAAAAGRPEPGQGDGR